MSAVSASLWRGVALRAVMVVGLCVTMFAGPVARADATSPSVKVEEVHTAAKLALAQGIQWLKQRSEKDPDGWIVPPGRIRRQVGTTNIVVHYSIKMMDVPVYEYKTVISFERASPAEPPKKVTRQQPVRQIGMEKKELKVWDPKGSIAELMTYPVYESGGNVYWHFSSVGDAAFATYALRCAGVPDTDPVIQRMLANLSGYLQQYGLPDQTWNLAWLTVVFAATPGKDYETRTRDLAARILDGQISEGQARGLWGPMCLHSRYLASLLYDFLAVNADMKRKELNSQKKSTKGSQRALQDALDDLEELKVAIEGVSRQVLRFGAAEQTFFWDPNTDPKVVFSGSSHLFYNQTAADIESTWVALVALAAAAEHDRLPIQSLRPARRTHASATSTGSRIVPPETATAVLARAANALAALQAPDGRWSECNIHQPVKDFDTFVTVLPVPSDPKSFTPLPSPVTATSAAQGLAALDNIGRAAGMERLLGGFRKSYLNGMSGRAREVSALIAAAPANTSVSMFTNSAAYDLLVTLAHPLAAKIGQSGDAEADLELTRRLVLAGKVDGSWTLDRGRGAYVPSSTRARYSVLQPVSNRVWQLKHPVVDLHKAHLWEPYAMLVRESWLLDDAPVLRDADGVATAAAVIYLASRVPESLDGVQALPGDALEMRNTYSRLLKGRIVRSKPEVESAVVAKSVAVPVAVPVRSNAVPPPGLVLPAESDVPNLPDTPAEPGSKGDEKF